MSEINPEDIDFMLEKIKDQAVRREITKNSHLFFFYIYLSRYVQFEMAPLHLDLFAITEDESIRVAAITAFRESAKSTIMSLSYALWSILGVQQKKFVVLLSRTQNQAKKSFQNIKDELERNSLLRADLGPFKEEEWNAGSIVIPKYNARIVSASYAQSIRGIRHGEYRPDLIICDDIEDSDSVRTPDSRNKTYEWFNSEIIPLGSIKTKIIIIGNLLHDDSLLMKLKKDISGGVREGVYREYPLIDEQGQCLWPGKFPNQESVEREKFKAGNKFSWSKEYLLKIIDDREAVIDKDWIHPYRDLPETKDCDSFYAVGIDLAISQGDGDYTAMVSAKVITQSDGSSQIYILPNPINEKLLFPEILTRIRNLVSGFGGQFSTNLYIEEVALQGYLTQFLDDNNFIAEGFKVHGMDKRTRLILTTHYIQSGKILFPEKGAELLIKQILDFGSTEHDDLVDAFTVLILKIIEKDSEPEPRITWV